MQRCLDSSHGASLNARERPRPRFWASQRCVCRAAAAATRGCLAAWVVATAATASVCTVAFAFLVMADAAVSVSTASTRTGVIGAV